MTDKEKIVDILLTDLQGCDGRQSIYCNTCRGSEKDDDVEERCDGCNRKQMFWGISAKCANEIADRIIDGLN